MKDFKLPIRSREEIDNEFNNAKVGDIIIKFEYSIWNKTYDYRHYKIVKKTPKGSLRLDNGELLKFFSSDVYIANDEIVEKTSMISLEYKLNTEIYNFDRYKRDIINTMTYDEVRELFNMLQKLNNRIDK